MKKTLRLAALPLIAAALFCSCAQSTDEQKQSALISEIMNDANSGVTKTPAAKAEDTTAAAAGNAEPAETAAKAPAADGEVDIDLTAMSSSMIYATVYDIVNEPEQYLGQSLLVDGYFDTGYNDSLDTRYYFVVIPDATACCMQGLEFIPNDGRSYPDDYPAEKADIRVRGTIDKYDELGKTYYYISADMVAEV